MPFDHVCLHVYPLQLSSDFGTFQVVGLVGLCHQVLCVALDWKLGLEVVVDPDMPADSDMPAGREMSASSNMVAGLETFGDLDMAGRPAALDEAAGLYVLLDLGMASDLDSTADLVVAPHFVMAADFGVVTSLQDRKSYAAMGCQSAILAVP